MSAKFTPRPDLDEVVARMIRDNVQRVVDDTVAEAKRQAPPTKTWTTVADPFVRRTHRPMHGEEMPDNLRFQVQAYQWDVDHPGAFPVAQKSGSGGHQMRDAPIAGGQYSWMVGPRDRSVGHYVQVAHCRCFLAIDPQGVAKWVSSERATVSGTKVKGLVYAEHEYVIPAEYGDVYPGGFVAEGTYFMHRTVIAMGNRA